MAVKMSQITRQPHQEEDEERYCRGIRKTWFSKLYLNCGSRKNELMNTLLTLQILSIFLNIGDESRQISTDIAATVFHELHYHKLKVDKKPSDQQHNGLPGLKHVST